MADSKLDVILTLKGARRFTRDAQGAAGGVDKIGRAGRNAGRQLKETGRHTDRLRKHMSGLKVAAGAGAAVLAGAGFAAAKNAITTTEDLAKTTAFLTRVTGLDTKAASQWAAAAEIRDVDAKALKTSFGVLAVNISKGAKGTAAQTTAFKRLGISQADLRKSGGDLNVLMPQIAEGFKGLHGSAKTAETGVAIFGRGFQNIFPLFKDGKKSMQDQLSLANKYGATLGGKPLKTQEDLTAVGNELKFAQLGWQVQFSTQIAPRLVKGFGWILRASQHLKGIFRWADDHPKIVKAALAMTGLAIAVKKVPGGTWLARHMLSGLGGLTKRLLAKFIPAFAAVKTEAATSGKLAGIRMSTAASEGAGSPTQKSRWKGIGGKWGRWAGPAAAAAIVPLIANDVGKWIDEHTGGKNKFHTPGGPGGTGKGSSDFTDSFNTLKRKLGFQHGGRTPFSGVSVVGEAGPEIARFPAGTEITPMPHTRSLSRDAARTIVVPVQIDGREVAKVVAKDTANASARR